MTAPALGGLSGLSSAPGAPAGRALATRLDEQRQTLAVRGTAASVLLAVALLGTVVALSALLLANGRWIDLPAALPLLLAVVAVSAAAATFLWRHRHLQQRLTRDALAAAVEREQRLREGSLRGALEVAATGVLGARAADDVAGRLVPGTLTPELVAGASRALLLAGGAAIVGAASLFTAARVAPDGLAAVLQPVSAWRGTLLPALAFDGLSPRVPRGMPVTLAVVASGRHSITVSWRAEGEPWRDSVLAVPNEGRVTLALGAVRAATAIRVNDGRSPELSAALVVEERGWIGDVALRAMYPCLLYTSPSPRD